MIRIAVLALLMTACTAQGALTQQAAAKTQLYCGLNTASGPLVVALVSAADPTAAGVAVTTKAAVDAACALAGGIPVAPPAVGIVAPRVAVPGPVATVKA